MTRPRILIVGAGAIGTYVACRLGAVADVSLLVRPGRVAPSVHSLRIIGGPDEGEVDVEYVSSLDEAAAADVIIVAVKGPDTAVAVEGLRGRLGPQTVVLELQNGVDRADAIDEILGERRTLAGAIYLECVLESVGAVRYLSGARRIVFGEPDGRAPTPRVTFVGEILRAASFDFVAPDDVRPDIWRKFALVCAANSLTSLTGGTFGDVLGMPDAHKVIVGVLSEVVDVGRASGVDLPTDAPTEWFRFLEQLGPSLRSSMLHDVTAGKRTEVEELNGAVLGLATSLGVPVPRNEVIALALRAHNSRVERSEHE